MSQFKKRAKLSSSDSSDRDGEPWSQSSRAEKSRCAAKMRRDKEGVEIAALAKLLPFPEEITSKLDKGSIIRLTTSYLRIKKFTQKDGDSLLDEVQQQHYHHQQKAITNGNGDNRVLSRSNLQEGQLMLEALNGFVIFISRKGRILYVAENVVKHLGIPQHDMIGNNIVEFIHPDDQKELSKQFVVKRPGQQSYQGFGVTGSGDSPLTMEVHFFGDKEKKCVSTLDYIQERSFFMRVRSVTPKKGTGGKGKVIGYRLVQCSGRLKLKSSSNSKGYIVEGLIFICRPVQPSPILEIRMDGNMFMSRHSLDMSFTFCDPRIITLIGYEPHELIGKTAYQFHNPLDVGKISSCHSNLIVKGTSISKYYRFLGKSSEWIWMQTRATIIYNTNNEAQYLVCQNYVIGKDEGDKYLMLEQTQAAHANGLAKQGDSEDSGIESSGASPNPSLGASSPGYSIYNSPGFMTVSEVDVMEVDMESQLIRDPVQHVKTQKVVKPKEDEDISFSGLVKKAEIEDKVNNGTDIEMSVAEENTAEIQVQNIDTKKVDKMLVAESSPCSDGDSICSDSDISSVTSPPEPYSCERKEHRSLPMIDDSGDENMDESMIKDLLEITKDDYTKDNDSQSKYQNESVMFTVTSPAGFPACSPLSSKLTSVNSPCSVNTCTGSPDDIFLNSPLSPTQQFLDSELSDIVDKLGTEDISEASDLFSTLLGNNSSPFTLSSTTATKVTTVVSGDTSRGILPGILETTIHKLDTKLNKTERKDSDSLPDELAEFSMEFCDKLVDEMAESAMTQLGGAIVDCQEMPEIPTKMLTWMNNMSPAVAPQAALAQVQNPQVETKEKTSYPPEESKPIQQRCPTLFAHLTAHTALEESTPQKDTPAHEVTEKISMLGISDDKNTPLLRALLTGDEVNPLASKPAESTSVVIGPLTPMEKQITDTILDLEESPAGDSRQIVTNLQFENNNVAQQADLLVLQEQQRQRYILEQSQTNQQTKLIDEHMRQRDVLEQKLNKQLILQQLLKQKLKESQLQEEQQHILEEQQTEQVQDQQLSHLKEKRLLLQRQLQERRQVLEQQHQLQQQLQQINLLQGPYTSNNALEKADSLLQQYLQEPSRITPPTNSSEAIPIQQQHQMTQQFRPQCNVQQITQPINQQPFGNGAPLSLPPQQQPWQPGLQQQQIPCQRNIQSNRQCQEQIQYPNFQQQLQQQQQQQDYPPPLVHQGLPTHLSQQIVDYHQQLHSMSPWQQTHPGLFNGNQQVVDQQNSELSNQDLSFPLQH